MRTRILLSNGLIIASILTRIGWNIYITYIYDISNYHRIMYVVNLCVIFITGYMIPSLAIIIKLWMAVNNMMRNISKDIVTLRDFRD